MIKLINNKEFINIVNLICSIKEEVNISFMKDKIYLRAVHSTNSNALVVEIKNTFFKEYNIENEMTYTISLENMIKLLKLCKKEIEISFNNDVIFIKSDKNEFELNYFIGNKDERPHKEFEHTVIFEVDSSKFYDNLEDAHLIDPICKFHIDDDFYILSKNHNIKSKIELENINFIKKENIDVYFDLDLLKLSQGLKNLFSIIKVKIANDFPLVIINENDVIKCEFMLAARCDENE